MNLQRYENYADIPTTRFPKFFHKCRSGEKADRTREQPSIIRQIRQSPPKPDEANPPPASRSPQRGNARSGCSDCGKKRMKRQRADPNPGQADRQTCLTGHCLTEKTSSSILLAWSMTEFSNAARYILVVFSEVCPIPALMTVRGTL